MGRSRHLDLDPRPMRARDDFERAVLAALRDYRERDPEIDRLAHIGSSWELILRMTDEAPVVPRTRRGAMKLAGVHLVSPEPESDA